MFSGVDIHWIQPPPAEIKAEEPFNVTYELVLTDLFYEWAVISAGKSNYFASLGFE